MMPVTILDEAQAELREAVQFYEDKRPGLGFDLAVEAESAVELIQRAPDRWQLRDDGTRRYLLHRFPYIVVYLVLNDHIWVIAFAHCRRRPGYWSERAEQGLS